MTHPEQHQRPSWVCRPAAGGPRLVHVSAHPAVGGVAELLDALVPAQAAPGRPTGWAVVGGDPEFLAFTRRLHLLLHDRADPSGAVRLDPAIRHYRATLAPQAAWLADQLSPGDVVVLHDSRPLGMAPALAEAGIRTVWHCHGGSGLEVGPGSSPEWTALATELVALDAVVSTLPEFAPMSVPPARRHVAAPAIDPRSARNVELTRAQQEALLAGTGLTGQGSPATGRVEQDRPLPPDARVVVQASSWDPLKDMAGALRCVPELPADVHLVLAGPDPAELPDDPDLLAGLDAARAVRAGLSPANRARTHLVLTSAKDPRQAALVLNALQRRADVVLHKSLAEGFGLPVTDAMFKGRAVVAAAVGGLVQQISPGHNGLLVDPKGVASVADALTMLLDDPLLRRRLGKHAAESVNRRFLLPRLVSAYDSLFATLTEPARGLRAA